MSPEGMTMNDAEGKPCRFCGEPIDAAEGYAVAPGGEREDGGVYHDTETRRCYYRKKRGEKPEGLPQ